MFFFFAFFKTAKIHVFAAGFYDPNGVFPTNSLLWGAHIVQAVALRFGDLHKKSPSESVQRNKASAGETETLHIFIIYSSSITLFYLKLFSHFSHFRYRKDNETNPKTDWIKTLKKNKDDQRGKISRVRPWGQWTPGAQWYLAGIHHSLCSWTSRRTAEVVHTTLGTLGTNTLSAARIPLTDSHRRSICPKANWNIWSLWTQIGCTLLVDLSHCLLVAFRCWPWF